MITLSKSFPGRIVIENGEEYLYFGGTSYLGLQSLKPYQKLLCQGIKKYGTAYAASRLSNLRMTIYETGESHLRDFFGVECLKTVSSGFMASQLTRRIFKGAPYRCFFAPGTHTSLMTDVDQWEKDYKTLEIKVNALISSNPDLIPVIFFDSVQFGRKDPMDFKWIEAFPENKVILVADESHAFGITGPEGAGNYSEFKKFNPKDLIICGSLGKGFGLQQGIIGGSSRLAETIEQDPWYGGSSPALAANYFVFRKAGKIYKKRRKKLKKRIQEFMDLTNDLQRFEFNPDHASFGFRDADLSNYLYLNKIVVTNFNYPNNDSPLMSRIVISASHSSEDIHLITNLLNQYKKGF